MIVGGRYEGRKKRISRDFDKARDCLALAQVLAAIRGAAAKGVPAAPTTMKGAAATAAAGVLAAPVGSSRARRRRPEDRGEGQLGYGRAPRIPQQRGDSGCPATAPTSPADENAGQMVRGRRLAVTCRAVSVMVRGCAGAWRNCQWRPQR